MTINILKDSDDNPRVKKVGAALEYPKESTNIEFKEDQPWETLQYKIIRIGLSLSNLRDGGLIIVGVSERGTNWSHTGISEQNLVTYENVDNIIDKINSYSSPSIDPEIFIYLDSLQKKYVVFNFQEFKEIPHICKKEAKINSKKILEEGAIYIRPIGKAKTTKIMDADHMRDIIELAAEKKARKYFETTLRLIPLHPEFEISDSASKKFERERGSL